MEKEVTVLEGQSLFDLAVQTAGSVEAVFALAVANGLGITGTLQPGQLLATVTVREQGIYAYYRAKGLAPATGRVELPGGIGYMGIGIDFIIS